MSWMRFLHRKRSDSELRHEIEAFLAEETADNEARGLTPDEARRQARLKFGNPQKVRESLWMQNTPQRLAGIARDVKCAFRTLSRRRRGRSVIRPELRDARLGARRMPRRFTVIPEISSPVLLNYHIQGGSRTKRG